MVDNWLYISTRIAICCNDGFQDHKLEEYQRIFSWVFYGPRLYYDRRLHLPGANFDSQGNSCNKQWQGIQKTRWCYDLFRGSVWVFLSNWTPIIHNFGKPLQISLDSPIDFSVDINYDAYYGSVLQILFYVYMFNLHERLKAYAFDLPGINF